MKWKPAYYDDEYKFLKDSICELYNYFETITDYKIKHFDWQNEINPSGKAIIWLALYRNKVVGQYKVIPMNIHIDGQNYKASLSLDTLTHPDFRRQGIFTILAERTYQTCKENNIFFTYGFPNQSSYHGFINKLNFLDIGQALLMAKVVNFKNVINNVSESKIPLIKLFSVFGKVFSKIVFKSWSRKKQFEKIVFKKIDTFDTSFDEFWNRVKKQKRIIGVRNSEFLNWRYSQNPFHDYFIFKFLLNDRIIGFIVYNQKLLFGVDTLIIVDMLFDNTLESDIFKNLIESTLDYLKKNIKFDLILCLITKKTFPFDVLRRNGFKRCPSWLLPQPFPVILRIHKEKFKEMRIEELEDWYLTFGSYDIF